MATLQNLATQSQTTILSLRYSASLRPLLDALLGEMNDLFEAKKHFVIYTKEDEKVSPLAPFVQTVLTFQYKIAETVAWQKWREAGKRDVEEPVRYSNPTSASANLVIEGLPGGTVNLSASFIVHDYNGKKKLVQVSLPQIDWGLNLGSRHFPVVDKYLKTLTLAAIKAKVSLELTEPTE